MKVIGAGFGRTGTASLKAALEMLGYGPCYHMSTVIRDTYRVRQWLEISHGRGLGWDEVLAGFQSALDWPAAAYWRELAEHYPGAKVILTVRDPDRWYDSVSATIFARALAGELNIGQPPTGTIALMSGLAVLRSPICWYRWARLLRPVACCCVRKL